MKVFSFFSLSIESLPPPHVFSCLYLLCKGMEDEGKEFSFKENNTKENYPLEKENYTKKNPRLYAVAKEMKKGKTRSYL